MQHQHKYKIEHIQREPNLADKAQRQSLLTKIQQRYDPEKTLVQIIESDMMILETDIRKAFNERSNSNISLEWMAINAIRSGKRSWEGWDTYPHWPMSIKDIMPDAHYMERMIYTFRPFPELYYDNHAWRPWPQGWSKFTIESGAGNTDYTPLLAHYGYRGPTHMYLKYKDKNFKRYKEWDFTSPKTVAETVPYFNGLWNAKGFPMSRQGWKNRKHT